MPAAEMSSRSISPLVVCSVSTPVSSAFRTEMLPLTDERLALSAFTSEIFIYPEVVPAVIVPPRVVLTKIFPLVVTSCVSATFSSDALTAPEALDTRSVSCGLTRPLTYTSPDCVAASTVPIHFSGMRRMTASSSETARRWKRPGFFSVMRSTPPSSTTLTRSGVFAPRAAIETVLSVVE